MKICSSCGNKINGDANFCSHCGYNQQESLENSQKSSINMEHIKPDSNKSIVSDNKNDVYGSGIRKLSKKRRISIVILIMSIVIISVGILTVKSYKLNHVVDAFKESFNNKQYANAQQIYNKDKNNEKFTQQISNYMKGKILETKNEYINKKVVVSEAKLILENTAKYKSDDSNNVIQYIQKLEQSKRCFANACQEVKEHKYNFAIEAFSKVIASDENYQKANAMINKILPEMKKEGLLQAKQQYLNKKYGDAISTIAYAIRYDKDDKDLIEKKAFYINEKDKADRTEIERNKIEEDKLKLEEKNKRLVTELNLKKQACVDKIKADILADDQISQIQNLNRNVRDYFVYSITAPDGTEDETRYCVDTSTFEIFLWTPDSFAPYN